jgi:hypothetical protein
MAKPDRPSPSNPTPAPAEQPIQFSNYTDQLKHEFNTIFATLALSSVQTAFLKSRWLDQVLWMENKSASCRDRHFRLRLVTIVGGVIVPILVTLNLGNQKAQNALKATTIGISGLVAVTSAVEEFFQYGKRWYSYRRAAESLKAEGWQFFQLSGPYRTYTTHKDAFITFVDHIEDIIQRDVEVYVTQSQQKKTEQKGDDQESSSLQL